MAQTVKRIICSGEFQPTGFVLVLFILMQEISVDSEIVQGPSNTSAKVNESTYFNCSTSKRPVDKNAIWFHFPLDGGGQRNYVYDDGRIMTNYKHRFVIEIDNSTGEFNLLVKRLEIRDAGRYECRDDVYADMGASAELTVLGSYLVCESEMDPGGVIGPTQCEKTIAPDEVQMACSLTYSGKNAPEMAWRRAGDPLNSTSRHRSTDCVNRDNRVTCNTTITADLQLNGSVYICKLTTQQFSCSLRINNILYAFANNSTKSGYYIGEDVTCKANASRELACSYRWYKDNTTEVSSHPTFTPDDPGLYKCQAQCPMRGDSCIFTAMLINVTDGIISVSTAPVLASTGQNWWFLLLSLLIGLLVIAIIIVVAKKRSSTLLLVPVLVTTREILSAPELKTIVDQIRDIFNDKSNDIQEAVSDLQNYGLFGVSSKKKDIVFYFYSNNLKELHNLRGRLMTDLKTTIESIYNKVLSKNVDIELTLDDTAFIKAEKKLQEITKLWQTQIRQADTTTTRSTTRRLSSLKTARRNLLRPLLALPGDDRGRNPDDPSTKELELLPQGLCDSNKPNEDDSNEAIQKAFNAGFIGKGSNGIIYGPGQYRGKDCAVEKIMLSTDDIVLAKEEEIRSNGRKWMALDHGNLIKFYDIVLQPSTVYIIMEYGAGGSVREGLNTYSDDLPIGVVMNWASQIAQGMNFLHNNGIVHDGLKCAKILIMEPSGPSTSTHVTLKLSSYNLTYGINYTTPGTFKASMYAWMAPETFSGSMPSKYSDIWSYGVTVWEILTREIPYKNKGIGYIIQGIHSGRLSLKIPESCPKVLRSLFKDCWRHEPNKRPSFSEILRTLSKVTGQLPS